MSSRESKVCKRARTVIKMMRWANRHGSGTAMVPQQLQDPGFLSWLGGHLRSIGEGAGDLALWIGRNTLRAWELYRTYQQLTGGAPLPLSGFQQAGTASGFTQSLTGQGFPVPQFPSTPAPPPQTGGPTPVQPTGRTRNGTPTGNGSGTDLNEEIRQRRQALISRARTSREPFIRKVGSFLS